MTSRAILLVLCVAALPLGNGGCAAPDSRQERIRTLAGQLRSPDPYLRGSAARGLDELAPVDETAVPALLEALNDKEYGVRALAAEALGRTGASVVPRLIEVVRNGKGEARHNAASALARIGPEARSAVPALLEALHGNDADLRRESIRALPRVGLPLREVVEALIPLLADPNQEIVSFAANELAYHGKLPEESIPALVPALARVLERKNGAGRHDAMQLLGKFGPKAASAVPALIALLKDEDSDVASTAAYALRRISPASGKSVAELIQILEDKQRPDRWWAAWALGTAGPDAREAAAALAKAARDENADVRRFATQALWKVDKSYQETAAALVLALQDEDVWVRRRAAKALGTAGQIAEVAGPALAAALKDKDTEVRWRAADALSSWSRAAGNPQIIAALAEALSDEDWTVRQRAAWALAHIGRGAKAAVPALARLLLTPSLGNRDDAAITLGRIGPDAAVAMPALVLVLEGKDTRGHFRALGAVAGIGPAARAAVPSVVAILKAGESHERIAAAEALGAIGPVDETVAAALVAALADSNVAVCRAAAAALVKAGFKGKELVPVLVEEMNARTESVRRQAAETLCGLNPAAKDAAVAGLVKIVQSDDAPGRWEAVRVLARFGRADAAIPALRLALESKDPAVRRQATYFLDEMGPAAMGATVAQKEKATEGAPGKTTVAEKPEAHADALFGPYRLTVDRIDRNPAEGQAGPSFRVNLRLNMIDPKTRKLVLEQRPSAFLDNSGIVVKALGPGGEDFKKVDRAWANNFRTGDLEIPHLEVPAGVTRLGELRVKVPVFTPAEWKAFDFPDLGQQRLEPKDLGPCEVAFAGDKERFSITVACFVQFKAEQEAWTARTGMHLFPWEYVINAFEITDASGKRLRHQSSIMPSGGSVTATYVALGESKPGEAEVRNPDGTVQSKFQVLLPTTAQIQYPVRVQIQVPESGKVVPVEFILKDIPLPAANEKMLFFESYRGF